MARKARVKRNRSTQRRRPNKTALTDGHLEIERVGPLENDAGGDEGDDDEDGVGGGYVQIHATPPSSLRRRRRRRC